MFNWFKNKNKTDKKEDKLVEIKTEEEKKEDLREEKSFINSYEEENNIEKQEELEVKASESEIKINQENLNNNKENEEKNILQDNNSDTNENDGSPEKINFFKRLMNGLDKTKKEVGIKINTALGNYVKIDDDLLEDLEDILISADIGMETTMTLIDNLRETIIREKINNPSMVKDILKAETKKLMNENLNKKIVSTSPSIILVVGVNGVGKTTTIGKLSKRYKDEGKSVLIAAADTFRAAAIDQLKEWGNRVNVDVISHSEGQDPAAVVFDAISAAKSRKIDMLIVDTAGRLHNKANLMKELEKINRIVDKNYPEAYRETILVLDATTGQNAMNQAKTFKEAVNITGIALTKLDGTAKGGVVIALQSELQIPIKLVGVGEGIYDLQDFNLDNFLDGIFG